MNLVATFCPPHRTFNPTLICANPPFASRTLDNGNRATTGVQCGRTNERGNTRHNPRPPFHDSFPIYMFTFLSFLTFLSCLIVTHPRGVSYTSQRIEEEEGSGRARHACPLPRPSNAIARSRRSNDRGSDDYGAEKCGDTE